MDVIRNGNPDGSPCTVYDILENVSYTTTRDSMLHSIRKLVESGYVERKDKVTMDGKAKRVFGVTSKALEII
jgi:hypothetical protein